MGVEGVGEALDRGGTRAVGVRPDLVSQRERQRGVDRPRWEDRRAEHVALVEVDVRVVEEALLLLVHAFGVQVPGDLDADQVGLVEARIRVDELQGGAGRAADVEDPAGADEVLDLQPFAVRRGLERVGVGLVVAGGGESAVVADHRVVHAAPDLRIQGIPVENVNSARVCELTPLVVAIGNHEQDVPRPWLPG
ncbi:hypothetical protein [Kribbella qitaiheensis]|uniref:hypothetical protein n=1 Tax=Kribbella qitaiheensis TaxID=1544730 RepID=UPI0016259AE3|nr:hypothetical protein [Kribbella qitaiheensis]